MAYGGGENEWQHQSIIKYQRKSWRRQRISISVSNSGISKSERNEEGVSKMAKMAKSMAKAAWHGERKYQKITAIWRE